MVDKNDIALFLCAKSVEAYVIEALITFLPLIITYFVANFTIRTFFVDNCDIQP